MKNLVRFHKITFLNFQKPKYLIVQKNRFIWKKGNELAGTEATKSKILKKIMFPKVLDVYDFCCEDL